MNATPRVCKAFAIMRLLTSVKARGFSTVALCVLAVLGGTAMAEGRTEEMAPFVPGRIIVKLSEGVVPQTNMTGGYLLTGSPSLDLLNIRFGVRNCSAPFTPPPREEKARRDYEALGMNRFYVFESPPETDIETMVALYGSDPNVELAEPDYRCRAHFVPDDPYYQQWQWGLPQIEAPAAWDSYEPDHFGIVAILDSGLDMDHQDFWWTQNQGVIERHPAECSGLAGVDDDHNGYVDDCMGFDFRNGTLVGGTWYNDANGPEDDNGHGTHVAGIVGAISNNATSVSSIMGGRVNNQLLLPVKVLDWKAGGAWDTVAAGIYYAANNNASVINMSLGGTGVSELARSAVNYAWSQGCVLVASMGNCNNDTDMYPAAFDHVIAVGATKADDSRCNSTDWSGWSADGCGSTHGSNYGDHISVVAPGNSICSTIPADGEGWMSGTSMAAPFVSGLAGLIRAGSWPEPAPEMVQMIIESTADDMVGEAGEDSSGWDKYMGWGRINAAKALNVLPVSIFSDGFDDGNVSDWTITNQGAAIGLDSNMFFSAPYSLFVRPAWGDGEYATALSPPVDYDNESPYEITVRFRYSNFHWDQFLIFGHVRLLLDVPWLPIRYDPIGDYSYQPIPNAGSFESYLPPGTWGLIKVTVFPKIRCYCISIDGTSVGTMLTYEESIVPSNRVYFEDNPGGSNFLDANYDDFAVKGSSEAADVSSEVVARPYLALEQNAPNPFVDGTRISYTLPEAGTVLLRVCDVDGGVVRALVAGHQRAGRHGIDWDGRSDAGWLLPQGVYFYQLELNGREKVSRKGLLIR